MKQTPDQLNQIRERVEKVSGLLVIDGECEDFECPLCEGDGRIDGKTFNQMDKAVGMQVFGIGKDLENLEAFVRGAFTDIPALLEHVELMEKEVERRSEAIAIMRDVMQRALDDTCLGAGTMRAMLEECVKDSEKYASEELARLREMVRVKDAQLEASAGLLDEVQTGEDFECRCWGQAIENRHAINLK